jgi:hypothetical protein
MTVPLEMTWLRPAGKPQPFGVSIHHAVSGQAIADGEVSETEQRLVTMLPGPGRYAINIERRRGVFPSYRFAENRQKTLIVEVAQDQPAVSLRFALLPW